MRISLGTGIGTTRTGSVAITSVKPPKRQGAMLSACADPLAAFSPTNAYFNNCALDKRLGSNSFAATRAPTAEAAEPPIPDPIQMPLRRLTSKPNSNLRSARSLVRPAVAAFCFGSEGNSRSLRLPVLTTISLIKTVSRSIFETVTTSPTPSIANPRISKPTATFATVAGANTVAAFIAAPPRTKPVSANPRTRPPR